MLKFQISVIGMVSGQALRVQVGWKNTKQCAKYSPVEQMNILHPMVCLLATSCAMRAACYGGSLTSATCGNFKAVDIFLLHSSYTIFSHIILYFWS